MAEQKMLAGDNEKIYQANDKQPRDGQIYKGRLETWAVDTQNRAHAVVEVRPGETASFRAERRDIPPGTEIKVEAKRGPEPGSAARWEVSQVTREKGRGRGL